MHMMNKCIFAPRQHSVLLGTTIDLARGELSVPLEEDAALPWHGSAAAPAVVARVLALSVRAARVLCGGPAHDAALRPLAALDWERRFG